MGGFDHTPAPQQEQESEHLIARNARIGLRLFCVYLALYGAFVLLNTFRPQVMDTLVVAGVNLAIVYGLGLIVVALLMALLYGWLCRALAADNGNGEDQL